MKYAGQNFNSDLTQLTELGRGSLVGCMSGRVCQDKALLILIDNERL